MTWTPDEQAVLDDIRRAGGFRTDEDDIKGALFWYARFLDLEVHHDVFALALPAAMRAHAAAELEAAGQGDLFAGEVGA